MQYVELETLRQSDQILWSALARLLLELESKQASDLLRRLQGLLLDELRKVDATQSASDAYLRAMYEGLVGVVLLSDSPSD